MRTEFDLDGEAGWMRRGGTTVVFSIADGPQSLAAPGGELVLAWDATAIEEGQVRFEGPGVAVFR